MAILICNRLLLALLGLVTIPRVCIRARACAAVDRPVQTFLSFGWSIASAASITLGSKCRLLVPSKTHAWNSTFVMKRTSVWSWWNKLVCGKIA